jgi:hypothetical protein
MASIYLVGAMKRSLGILAAALYLAVTGSSALAHHNHLYFYDQCKSVTIEGRVDSVEFTGPHARIVIRLDNGTTYTVDWMTPNNLRRSLILEPAQKALALGARVSVMGAPIRTAAEIRGYVPDFTRDVNPSTIDAKLIHLVDDSFNWARPPQNPDLCKGK